MQCEPTLVSHPWLSYAPHSMSMQWEGDSIVDDVNDELTECEEFCTYLPTDLSHNKLRGVTHNARNVT